ncbi:M42 family peptidase [Clostridium sp. JN-9]|uniref:M42 family peptidase n=1 Tax=Clostridium sp. JN-9 TaxID=2507159 RepID=UPI000FFE08BF|nr:M42 family peptidase [Clostridium sp. JN-9]QAT38846.1 M42 family peptidase [Clostridium sp. JN-9]
MDKLFNELLDTLSLSGSEEYIIKLIKKNLPENVVNINEDKMGNLIVKVGQGDKKIMICTHTDEKGLIASYIEKDGKVRVEKIGDFNNESVQNSIVSFNNGIKGKLISSNNELLIDLGMNSRDEVLKSGIREGYVAGITGSIVDLKTKILGSNISDKAGIYILLKTIEQVKELHREINFVFSTQGQLGGRGARAAAYSIDPDYCIVVNAINSNDKGISIDKGPVLKIMDKTLIGNNKIISLIESAAEKNNINIQRTSNRDSSLGSFVHKERSGIPTAEIDVPCRYKGSSIELVSIEDINNTEKLIKDIIEA